MAINIAGASRFSSNLAGSIPLSTIIQAVSRKMSGFEVGKSCEVQRVTQRDAQLAMKQVCNLFSNGHKNSWCEPI